jgi:hypothetical protein
MAPYRDPAAGAWRQYSTELIAMLNRYDNTEARTLFGGGQLFAPLCGIVVEQTEWRSRLT